VADALLGAVADGDIGQHFPDSDVRWKDADSIELLRQVTARLAEAGWSVGNVDATVIAEIPKIAPHVPAMCRNLAGAMGVDVTCVSVKGTTVEQMGAMGRREGIAVMATAMVCRADVNE
jgi:2-C-methyl-D-erythritol 2,4-cyclodiphosphate synthase